MNYIDAVPDVISQIPTAPDFVIVSAFNRAARKFCEVSTAYRYTFANLNVVANQQTYSWTVPTDTMTNEVHTVRINSQKIDPATEKFIAVSEDKTLDEVGSPRLFVWKKENSFSLHPTPQTDDTAAMLIEVSLKPTRAATSIADWIADKYYEVLLAGTTAELTKVPNTEYYDPQQFQLNEAYFVAGIEDAKKEARGADRSVPRRVRYGGY